jgi:hypothetical protein
MDFGFVSAIIIHKLNKNNVLVVKNDNNKIDNMYGVNKWRIFTTEIVPGEDPKNTLKKELSKRFEDIKIRDIIFMKDYFFDNRLFKTYFVILNKNLKINTLYFADYKWVNFNELADMDFYFDYKKRLKDYFMDNYLFQTNYDPPYDILQIKKKYPKKAKMLLNDPVHVWRATTGIELIHKEPDEKEQMRIWKNWQKMTAGQKKFSDKISINLFNMTNKEHHQSIIKRFYS